MDDQELDELFEQAKKEFNNRPPLNEEEIQKVKNDIFKYNQNYVDNTSEFERNIYINMINSIITISDYTKDLSLIFDGDDSVEFIEYIPYIEGRGFIISKKYSSFKIYPVYPENKSITNHKIDITKINLSTKLPIYSDFKSQYPYRETKESLIKKIKNNIFMHTEHIEFELSNCNGTIVDKKTSYSKRGGNNPLLTSKLFISFLTAINDNKSLSLINNELNKEIDHFYSFENNRHDINDISISLNQICNIIKEKERFSFNDLDNSIIYKCKKGDYDCFIISEQNADFCILFKNKENYFVYQLAYDLSFNIEENNEDRFVNFDSDYLNGGIEYTNTNSYNYMISEEFIDNSSIEEILEKDCWLIKIDNNKTLINKEKGYLSNFGFNIVHSQGSLTEEFGLVIESINQYSGEPEIIFADSFISYPEMYSGKKSIRNHLFFVIGNGYSWNRLGYLESNEKKYSLNYEDSLKIKIPEESKINIYPLSEYSKVVNFPDNITDSWFEELKLAIKDVFLFGTNKDIFLVIEKLENREKTSKIINEFKKIYL